MGKPYTYSQREVWEMKGITKQTLWNRKDELNWEGTRVVNDKKLADFQLKRKPNVKKFERSEK